MSTYKIDTDKKYVYLYDNDSLRVLYYERGQRKWLSSASADSDMVIPDTLVRLLGYEAK